MELSPDGKHVAVERLAPRDGTANIWVADSDTGALTQFTFTGATHPKWTADGQFLTFNHERAILRKRIDGSGEEEVLRESDADAMGDRIREAVEAPFPIDGSQVLIGASVGVHLAPAAGDPDEALRAADHAMYTIKKSGGGRAQHEPAMAGWVGRHRGEP